VLVEDPNELERIREREHDMTKEKIELLVKAGANVILTTKGIDDFALKYFAENGCIAVRRADKEDLRRICACTGAKLMVTLADMDSEDGSDFVDPANLGECEEVYERRVGDNDMIFFRNPKNTRAQTVLLRGANDYMLDEMERSLHDALCAVKRALESERVVAGGGCVEVAVDVHLEKLALTLGSREQLAIAEFAQALLIIPKTLAVNAAQDATELVARLRSCHNAAYLDPAKAEYKQYGLDLVEGVLRNNINAGVLEPAMSKIKSLQFATEAAMTLLRIDDMIKMNPPPQQ
jgi:T-complex protein 1 subunit alpha